MNVAAIQYLFAKRGKELTCRQVKAGWITEHVDRIARSNEPLPAYDEDVAAYESLPDDIFRVQVIMAMTKLQRSIKADMEAKVVAEVVEARSVAVGNRDSVRRESHLIVNTPSPATLRSTIDTKVTVERDIKCLAFLSNQAVLKVGPCLPCCIEGISH
jgi:hypothetical protein